MLSHFGRGSHVMIAENAVARQDCQVNGNDVKASQVNMEVSCRPREEAQKEGMYEINGIRVVAQKGEEPVQERRYAVTFEPIEKVETGCRPCR